MGCGGGKLSIWWVMIMAVAAAASDPKWNKRKKDKGKSMNC